jgi:hypothetical protein
MSPRAGFTDADPEAACRYGAAIDEVWRQDRAEDPLQPLPYFRGEGYRLAPPRQPLLKGLLGAGELSVFYGAPKCGKSFLVTDLSLAVAAAVAAWFGHRIKRKGFVLYLVMEGAGGFPNRLAAWSKAHGRPVPDAFVWVPVRLSFMSSGAAGAAGAAANDILRIKALIERLQEETGLPCVLIVVDTCARAMTGADENSTRDMTLFLEQCAILQELPDRPHVLVVHHENAAGSKARGSTSMIGGGSTFVHVWRGKDGSRGWEVELAKDDADGAKRGFALHRTVVDVDEDKDEVASCVVVEADAPPDARSDAGRPQPRGKNQRAVYESLAAAICDGPDPTPVAPDIPPDAKGVGREKLEQKAFRYLTQKTGKAKREALEDALAALVERKVIRHAGGFYWLPKVDGRVLSGREIGRENGGAGNGHFPAFSRRRMGRDEEARA